MASGFLPTMAFAGGFEDEIITHNGFDYRLYNGNAILTGTYHGCVNVVIPSKIGEYTVTGIDWTAFCGCTSLTSITIPSSMTFIGRAAFLDCENLKTVYYTGSEAQRNNIEIDEGNEPLTDAKWYYNSCYGKATHTYSNNADTTCNVCGNFAYPAGNTLYKKNGKYYHVVNRKVVKDTTLVKYSGKYLYVKNGVYTKATTLTKFNGKYLYVKNGVYTKATTLVPFNGKAYYVKNGAYTKTTTLVSYGGKILYVKNGVYTKATGLVKYGSRYYYVKNGIMNPAFSGRVKIGTKTYTIRKGVVV